MPFSVWTWEIMPIPWAVILNAAVKVF